jgi:sulfate adenylyltransferase
MTLSSSDLIAPHGGTLVNLLVSPGRAVELRRESQACPSWDLTPRQLCDLELLLNGGFSPLRGFMARADYEAVCHTMRLADGTLWPIPITLDVTEEFARGLKGGAAVVLRDPEGVMLAVLHVQDVWMPDRVVEAETVYGTMSPEHPGVATIMEQAHRPLIGGTVEGLQLPVHYDFRELRVGPDELREKWAQLGWSRIVAFQTRNPMHRAHQELTLRAAREAEAHLLVHPVVGMTKPGDVDHYTRVRCYRALMDTYPPDLARLALLPLAMRMAGPREAVWHAIIRKNYGCTHLIVGRDHAGPGSNSKGTPFYGPYDAQEMVRKYRDELRTVIVPFRNMVYVPEEDHYVPDDEVPSGRRVLTISGTELRRRLTTGLEIPSWFTFPCVAAELRRTHPPRSRQGFTVFFTGLSGAGKSTVANALLVRLLELGGRQVTLLDGDVARRHLSSELGFSKEHRDLNIQRIGYVASEVTKNGGVALCAPIAPYDRTRKQVREMVEAVGGFILVYVATPIEVCEHRDRKGLYVRARAGLVKHFTGISDPYEPPDDATLVIDTQQCVPDEAALQIIHHLTREGYLRLEPIP